jgi:hypothetical protein
MTIEDILGMDSARLKCLTDAQLLEWFQPKLAITRPTEELRRANQKKGTLKSQQSDLVLLTGAALEERKLAIKLAQELGIDLSDTLNM